MIIKRIGVLSLAKLQAILGAGLGVLVGAFFALFSMVGGGAMMAAGGSDAGAGMGMMAGIGIAAIFIFPIIYGVCGFIGGLISAWLFNLAARFVGGLEIETQ